MESVTWGTKLEQRVGCQKCHPPGTVNFVIDSESGRYNLGDEIVQARVMKVRQRNLAECIYEN